MNNTREVFINDLFTDEIRNGFLVTSHRKKLWNVQIGLIQEFARICKKYNLRWFVFSGTLIGAIRHKGFIPWDDDVDIFMFRPDYEKFKQVAAHEIRYPYFLDAWFNYKLESEETADNPSDDYLQLVTREQETEYAGFYPFWPMLKLRDSRTAMIQWPERRHINQGVWIDIFAFDSAPPFTEQTQAVNWEVARELLLSIVVPDLVKNAMANNEEILLPYNELKTFMGYKYRQRALYFEDFMLQSFFDSEFVVDFRDYVVVDRGVTYKTSDFENIIYMPFEKIEVPVPSGYENILTARYGDWRKMIYTPSHVQDYSAEVSYEQYFKTVASAKPIMENDNIVAFLIEASENS